MTREIPLTRGKVAVVDDDMFDYLNQWKWQCSSIGYAQRTVGRPRKGIYMHRFVLGDIPSCMQVDHISGDRLDNRRANLRLCSSKQNNANRVRRSDRKYKGVYPKGDKWTAEIKHHNKNIWLGSFHLEADAALAYNEAAKKYHGEFAVLNVVE